MKSASLPGNSSHHSSERGAVLAMVAGTMVLIVMLGVLIFAVGFMVTGKSRLQNIANLASLAAMESYMRATGDHQSRLAPAIDAANAILHGNPLKGFEEHLGDLAGQSDNGSGSSGTIRFGTWHFRSGIEDSPAPPCGQAPCFEEGNLGTGLATAIKVEVKTQDDNLFALAFSSFANQILPLRVEAIASLVQRCTGFLLDVSGSSTFETHPPTMEDWERRSIGENPYWFINQEFVAPAFLPYAVPGSGFAPADGLMSSETSCQDPSYYPPFSHWRTMYCNVGELNSSGDRRQRRAGSEHIASPQAHYWDDYIRIPTVDMTGDGTRDEVWADVYQNSATGYTGPQPLVRYLLAFNASLRAIKTVQSSVDSAFLMIFRSHIVDTEPQVRGLNDPKLTKDLDPLIRLTNADNRGKILNGVRTDPAEVNFVSRGWFPFLTRADQVDQNASGIVEALDVAIAILARDCPAGAQRSLILATDGISLCKRNGSFGGITDSPYFGSSASSNYSCGQTNAPPPAGEFEAYWNFYNPARQQLLGTSADSSSSIKRRLLENQIALTTIMDGKHIDPNFRNIWQEEENGIPGHFLEYDEAIARGYGGIPNADPGGPSSMDATPTDLAPMFYNAQSTSGGNLTAVYGALNEVGSLNEDGELDVFLREPIGIFGELSMRSGGIFCPLLDICQPNSEGIQLGNTSGACSCTAPATDADGNPVGGIYEDHDNDSNTPEKLKDCCRMPNSFQTCSVYNVSKSMQAAACAISTIGGNPFILVAEDPPR